MTVAPSLLAVVMTAGTLAAQSPPQRPWCDQQSGSVQHRIAPTGSLVVSWGFRADSAPSRRALDSMPGRFRMDTTPLRADQLSPREAALIDSVVAMFPGSRGVTIRRSLMLRASVGLSIAGDPPAARTLVDQIFAIRRARRDSATSIELQWQRAVAAQTYPATLVPSTASEIPRRWPR